MTSLDAMYLLWLLSYLARENSLRTPMQRIVDAQTGFMWMSDTGVMEYMEGIYWEGNVPDYVQQILQEMFWPVKSFTVTPYNSKDKESAETIEMLMNSKSFVDEVIEAYDKVAREAKNKK